MRKSREEARRKREQEDAQRLVTQLTSIDCRSPIDISFREKQKMELEEQMKQKECELESFEAQLKRQLEEEQR